MGLTPDEIKNIDAALEGLKRSLKDEFAAAPKTEGASFDDAFLNQVAGKYLSATGVVRLLADARLQEGGKRSSCLCGCSCAQPSQGQITW
jgi:hypothetical protein